MADRPRFKKPGIRALLINLSMKFGDASMRTLNLIEAMGTGQVGLAALAGSPVMKRAARLGLKAYPVGRHKTDLTIVKRLIHLVRTVGFNVFDIQNPQSKLWRTLAGRVSGAGVVSTLKSW